MAAMAGRRWRVAVVDGSHGHVNGHIRRLTTNPQVELVGLTDHVPERAERLRAALGLDPRQVYADLDGLCDGARPEVVICCASNAGHAPVVEALAPRGIHVMVEKPFAATLEQAERMLRAARAGRIHLMCNWPVAWSPAWRLARRLVDQGRVGRLFEVRHRAGHNGPGSDFSSWFYRAEDGGGALLDFCSYGAHLSNWFFGALPSVVTALAATLVKPVAVEDNAVVAALWPQGMGVWEATWSRVGEEPGPGSVLYGTAGTLALTGGGVHLSVGRGGAQQMTADPLVEADADPIAHLLAAIGSGAAVHPLCTAEMGRDTQEVLEAARRAVATGQAQRLSRG